MVKFIGAVAGFSDVINKIFGEDHQIRIMQIKESRDSVEFHLQITISGVRFNSINKFNLIETKRTIVLFNDDQEVIAEKAKMFPVEDCPSIKS